MGAALIDRYDVALCDIDGVAIAGASAIPGAAEAIAAARAGGVRFVYVTNNASRTPEQVAGHLTDLSVRTEPADVMTSAMAAAALCAERYPKGTRVLYVGGAGLRVALADAGMSVTDTARDEPAVVVQGLAHDVGWRQLSEAVLAINAGATYIATNTDTTLPTERGLAIGNGALVAAVTAATGAHPESTGKPQPDMLRRAAHLAGASAPVMIGDRLDTDIGAGVAAGYPTVHVLTGVSDARAVLRADAAQRPTYLLTDLAGLTEPYEDAKLTGDGAAQCGDARAHLVDRSLHLDGSGAVGDGDEVDANAYRALAACAWAAADAGREVRLPAITVRSRT